MKHLHQMAVRQIKKNGQPPVVGSHGIVPADILRNFNVLVENLGGNPEGLLASASLSLGHSTGEKTGISFEAMTTLLENASSTLNCADFGMRLADSQRNRHMPNLFEVVMRNSLTLKDAFAFSASEGHKYSGLISVSLRDTVASHYSALEFDFSIPKTAGVVQLIEYMILRLCNIARDISGNIASPAAVHFNHAPISPYTNYQAYFLAPVMFEQLSDCVRFDRRHLTVEIAQADQQTCTLARYFIKNKFFCFRSSTIEQVRRVIQANINSQHCTAQFASSALGLNIRTLQRRLRDEGSTFDRVKDDVRRSITAEKISDDRVALIAIAEMLGYAELSTLTRSCHRWFSASPRQLRKNKSAFPALATLETVV